MENNVELSKIISIRNAMEDYQDTIYLNLIRQLNDDYKELTSENLGSEFIKNCGHDLAGEIVRNFFDTSEFYISTDQLVKRMLTFSYEDDYNPLAESEKEETIRKNVYANNEIMSSRMDEITRTIADSQEKLFTEERSKDKLDREKKAWRETQQDRQGELYDDLTGEKGETSNRMRNGKEYEASRLHADHIQSREAARYTRAYATDDRAERLREFYNSDANFQLMLDTANTSKGDVRVCIVDDEVKNYNTKDSEYQTLMKEHPECDITYKATPEQLVDAVCEMWEKETASGKKIEELKKHGYLDENGKVTKSVRKELIRNIRHSQNEESKVILKTTDYKQVSGSAGKYTAESLWKVVAGQILYYAAPPVIYEIKVISMEKHLTLEEAIDKLSQAGKRIGDYIYSNLKTIFINIAENSLKNFIKSFMDILIEMVKATVKRLLKIAKSLVLSTVDAVRIILDKNADSTHKADAVFNLFSVTITSCAVDVLFNLISGKCHLPEWLLTPLQILTTVVCTNFTMLILRKLDLFDVNYGFRMAQIRKLFEETNKEYDEKFEIAMMAADLSIDAIIEQAKKECIEIYQNLEEMNLYNQSVRGDLERINTMFSIGINYEDDWLKFIGVQGI